MKNPIFSRVIEYLTVSRNLQTHLSRYHAHWTRFQDEFNILVDSVYETILRFEQKEEAHRTQSLKNIFTKRYRRHFLFGEFIRWSYEKPYGYAGDFKIIDEIYRNAPRTEGFERLWDNYFQRLSISEATRQRKEDLKVMIADFISHHQAPEARIMNLACGSAREIKELLTHPSKRNTPHVHFDCYDADIDAISFAKELHSHTPHVTFVKKNALRIGLRKDITKEIPHQYDLIYSAGLFDYLSAKFATRLVANLKRLLKKDGMMIIANVNDRYSNPSVCWMEWVADWNLVYRNEGEFKNIFLDAGFLPQRIQRTVQKSNVIQYCICHN
ncbi:MAG: class I SAM-dependent methyltransferase [Candidatus Omnitrophica bacterium]|nr:class I SAM-dependent methyltransferase [Candidatus Omnitrophota bacterium]